MDRDFWLDRWSRDEIGFHQAGVNPWLQRFWPEFGARPGKRVFVPLCGKSLDLGWIAHQGHEVIGVELAESAVRAYFEAAGQPCHVQRLRHLVLFSGGAVSIYCGDFMDLIALNLRGVEAVYDRAALVALPPKMRASYADHMLRIVPEGCRTLLVTLEYDQRQIAGPPHSVGPEEVEALYGGRGSVELLHRAATTLLPPRFAEAGVPEAVEAVYRLVKLD